MDQYQGPVPHRPLPDTATAFRLVLLSPGAFDVEIQCSLVQVDLDAAPKYEALSYAWGGTLRTEPISLDGARFDANANLAKALRHLRHEDRVRTLWADGLCINQKDKEERSSQVKRMLSIYARADRTLVWLGDRSSEPLSTFRPGGIRGTFNFLHRGTLRGPEKQHLRGIWDVLHPPDPLHWAEDLQNAVKMVTADWFHRTWTIQEVAIAKQATIICDSQELSWDVFADGYSGIQCSMILPYHVTPLAAQLGLSLEATSFYREFFHHDRLRQKLETTPLPFRLLALLLVSSGHKATDPRDHIFALLGLAGCGSDAPSDPRLEIDYNKSVYSVLKNAALYLIEGTSHPALLYGAGSRNRLPETRHPSWMPTWQGRNNHFMKDYFDHREILYWQPGPGFIPEMTVSEDQASLAIRGRILCAVSAVGRKAGKKDPTSPGSHTEHLRSLSLAWEETILQPLIGGWADVWWEAHLTPRGAGGIPDGEKENWAKEYWDHIIIHGEIPNYYARSIGSLPKASWGVGPPNPLEAERIAQVELDSLHGGAPFATSNGLFGFFNDADALLERPQDTYVCRFRGWPVPFLIQGGPERYTLLGPCKIEPYLHRPLPGNFDDVIILV